MRLRILLFPVVLALQAVVTSWAEEPVKAKIPDAATADSEHYTVEFENQFVRVLRIHYGPKEAGNMHDHRGAVSGPQRGGVRVKEEL